MNLIPSHPYETHSSAEYRLFNKLQETFYGDPSYIAFHSLNLTHHQEKRFGEADFVILCEYGLFVLEVKGGAISCADSQWSTVNRNQQTFNIQNPFRQAEGAMHALANTIQQQFPTLTLPLGFGVVFPDVLWNMKGAEWDKRTVCDASNFRNLEAWFNIFFHYWQQKNHQNKLTFEQIAALKTFLRPNFELLEPLHHHIGRLKQNVIQLTEDQYRYLDIFSANKRVLCSGGAGTGKTFLAVELARRLAAKNCHVLLLCKSSWLRYYLQRQVYSKHITISTIDSLMVDKKRAGIEMYDALLMDEGQDLFNSNMIDHIDSCLKNGLEKGVWYIFHDVNNQAGLFIDSQPHVLDMLKNYAPTIIPLTTNCRNTLAIINVVKEHLCLDMGSKGTGHGPDVKFFNANNRESSASQLETMIDELLESAVSANAITILSPLSFNQSNIQYVSGELKRQIIELDDYSVRNFPIPHISFSEIKNFKGLENEVICVIDLKKPTHAASKRDKVLHYVAMTRARSLLMCFF